MAASKTTQAEKAQRFQALHAVKDDLVTEREIAMLPVKKAWNGIAWSPDGTRLYVGGGIENADSDVLVFEKAGETWKPGTGLAQ